MESTYDMNFTSGMVSAQIATASLANSAISGKCRASGAATGNTKRLLDVTLMLPLSELGDFSGYQGVELHWIFAQLGVGSCTWRFSAGYSNRGTVL
jgi:hypothetical protein